MQSIFVAARFRRFATMARYSVEGSSSTGATEHVLALASTNIGLPGAAINGRYLERNHARQLRHVFAALLGGNTKCAGLLCCELGNVDNLCSKDGRRK